MLDNSQEPILQRIFEISGVLFEKISVFYYDWSISWIWRTLRHVRDIFCKCHVQNASKEIFRTKKFLIPCTGSKVPFWQYFNSGKMELLNSCMEFKLSLTKRLLLNPGWWSVRAGNWDFLKKDSQDFKNSFQSRFLWILSKTGELN